MERISDTHFIISECYIVLGVHEFNNMEQSHLMLSIMENQCVCRTPKRVTGGCNLEVTMLWDTGQLLYSRTFLTVPQWLSGGERLWTPNPMANTPQLKWEVAISLRKALARLVTSRTFRLLMVTTSLELQKTLALTLSKISATVSKLAVLEIGVTTSTMVVLVETPIALESWSFMSSKENWEKKRWVGVLFV